MSVTIDGNLGVSKIAPGSAKTVTGVDLSGAGDVPMSTFRNKIINGDFVCNQQFAANTTTPAAGIVYVGDQWMSVASQPSKLTYYMVMDAPPGLRTCQRIFVASQFNPGPADYFIFSQPIEGYRINDLNFGTPNARKVTLSFWIKGSVPGTYNALLRNAAGSLHYVVKVPVTTSWNRVTFTIPGPTTGTWETAILTGLRLDFILGVGSNYTGTENVWHASHLRTADSINFVNQPNGATLDITGVQLEKGEVASEFEKLPYETILASCQRYYNSFLLFKTFFATVSGQYHGETIAIPPMRDTPTLLHTGTWYSPNVNNITLNYAAPNSFVFSATGIATGLPFTVQAGITCSASSRL